MLDVSKKPGLLSFEITFQKGKLEAIRVIIGRAMVALIALLGGVFGGWSVFSPFLLRHDDVSNLSPPGVQCISANSSVGEDWMNGISPMQKQILGQVKVISENACNDHTRILRPPQDNQGKPRKKGIPRECDCCKGLGRQTRNIEKKTRCRKVNGAVLKTHD